MVVYATSEKARDELQASIFCDLREKGLLRKEFLPYRRGCKAFERYLGPWREWHVGKGKPTLLDTLKIGDIAED